MVFEQLRIVVIGAGAIGGVIGAALARAGRDVTLVDVDSAHVDAIRRMGLTIDGVRPAEAVPICTFAPAQLDGDIDIVFLAVKSQHTLAAVESFSERLKRDGCVVSLQNGINEPSLVSLLGADRVIGAVVHVAADQVAPGRIIRHSEGSFVVGELDGADSARCLPILALLQLAAPTVVTSNIWGWLWTKQIFGCLLVATALTNETIGEQLRIPDARAVFAAALSEATQVALSAGVTLEQMDQFDPLAFAFVLGGSLDRAASALDLIGSRPGKGHSGMWRDIKIKRRISESAAVTGHVVRQGVEQGIPTPVNESILTTIQEIEADQREMSLRNFQSLAHLSGPWRRLPASRIT